jgi:glucosamine--fructose-6-phosphate aminotransferase (isomerizing)
MPKWSNKMTRLLNDILNEPIELTRTLAHTLGPGRGALDKAAAIIREARHVYITGIGSSWHAGMAVQSLFDAAGHPTQLVDASELLHYVALPPDAVLIALSRSGKSVEIVGLLDKALASGTRVIGITNTPDSPLAIRADAALLLEAAFDHNVSVTMYSALTLAGGLLATASAGSIDESLARSLEAALADVREAIPGWQQQRSRTDWLSPDAPTYFLARGGSLSSCYEARLLWEEAAKAPATAMSTGGFRHGPQEILVPGLRIGLWIDSSRMTRADLTLAADLRQRGAKVMLIGQGLPAEAADLVFDLPRIPTAWQFLIDNIPAQLAAEQLAHLRGVDCDSFVICPYIIETEDGLATR